MKKIIALTWYVSVLSFIPLLSAAQTPGTQNILFIFDASGSMWAKLDKSTRIQVAKETMGKLLDKINADANVGLIVYGHRNASDCNDIETMLPIKKIDRPVLLPK